MFANWVIFRAREWKRNVEDRERENRFIRSVPTINIRALNGNYARL